MNTMVPKTARIGAPASKPSSGKMAVKTTAASHILSAHKGARTLTHREIKQAVEKVFEERYGTNA